MPNLEAAYTIPTKASIQSNHHAVTKINAMHSTSAIDFTITLPIALIRIPQIALALLTLLRALSFFALLL